MERSGLAALVDVAEGSGLIQLESALEGRVTEEFLSLFNVDGSMRKTLKPHNHVSHVDMEAGWFRVLLD